MEDENEEVESLFLKKRRGETKYQRAGRYSRNYSKEEVLYLIGKTERAIKGAGFFKRRRLKKELEVLKLALSFIREKERLKEGSKRGLITLIEEELHETESVEGTVYKAKDIYRLYALEKRLKFVSKYSGELFSKKYGLDWAMLREMTDEEIRNMWDTISSPKHANMSSGGFKRRTRQVSQRDFCIAFRRAIAELPPPRG